MFLRLSILRAGSHLSVLKNSASPRTAHRSCNQISALLELLVLTGPLRQKRRIEL